MLKGARILLGITGGIAAYKTAELVRMLVTGGARVKAVMTGNAHYFITPATLETLTGDRVYRDTFEPAGERDIAHISLARWADVTVIAPATANIIGKASAGIADDLLSTTLVALKTPVLICPSMNTDMYTNPIFRDNLTRLSNFGYHILEAASGALACKTEGPGRLPPLEDIVEAVETILAKKDLFDVSVLVTAGPTREPFDPVRYITNHSTGKMGYALALMAKRRGARVTLVSGSVPMAAPTGVTCVPVTTAREMADAVLKRLDDTQVLIKAAAVADYRPARPSTGKIKKKGDSFSIVLERNPDIIAEAGRRKGDMIIVGFAMETDDLVLNALKKLEEKNLDLIVANDLREPGAGFGHDTNVVRILDREGGVDVLPLMDKKDVADRILDRVAALLEGRGGS
ncbi:MAG: bifunctional phosphopantothenoylcysteine decarboxylase/phosphopantothenate--cysteine ligase CoaBC [Syntrophales bacterium]|jgi:phosphopantothenoylcysteine decarboxylase/phosphopantothenate--cysteine ligase|nr:bifunctional phosphopantothenoylcysteine decarboxylase/phosphopantothenate--cysteine ligase CoaBC [Syntrophales bacterium]MCK9527441.1 bifunctional phosphopantothenoylcysteine decarboxylase/phosphopantothenate--cysteine ligase CoaBC [Syntrophales bacterium]MDX9921545.1 bifunctional phosphopantothenoylcysteine decarboxylase/phosphopantothenate--cysteine ligase CoaBC [Syntrophales bacterium]